MKQDENPMEFSDRESVIIPEGIFIVGIHSGRQRR